MTTRIQNPEELLKKYEEYKDLVEVRADLDYSGDQMFILVCGGTGCVSSKSLNIVENFNKLIKEHGMEGKVHASITGCFGFCEKGPIVKVFPENVFYVQVTPDDAKEIFEQHIIGGEVVDRLLYVEPITQKSMHDSLEMPFYKQQMRIALRHCGLIDPEIIEEYIGVGGYQSLAKVITQMTPEEAIDIMKQSGLGGRGGAGFSTGRKWEFGRMYKSDRKYVICNADEGDPGAFMDRSIMEGDAHTVIEGMAIAAYCIGADQGYVYIRAEYPLAVKRLQIAIDEARELGLLGKNILGTDFSFDVDVRLGAGAFVCGEETALIQSIQGNRGEPTTKPPFPAEKGLWQQPTIVNNVETLANVPVIFEKGAEWFAQIGTEKSKGTKVFALAGKVNNVGLVEVPMGTTLRELIFEIGGGVRGGGKFKAAQSGGPSGGCIPEQFLDTPIDYQSLGQIGSMMGSGGMIVMSDSDCMVNIARFYLEFIVEESCGRCVPCRVGTKRMFEILTDITKGKGTPEMLAELQSLAETIQDTALCGLGQTAPNPVLSTLKYFMDEYEEHVYNKRCPSGVCTDLLTYEIIPEKCIGCTACARACPVSCIAGAPKQVHVIDQEKCIKCGNCLAKCRFGAVIRK
jgi:NADH:ubiquinone oxidoreductase subunit F (NADH-binding)/(2Fe-2S) ferredoxin/ferredoxin